MPNGTETTVTFNVDCTIVFKGRLPPDTLTADSIARDIENIFSFDNVIVSDLKFFVNDSK